MKLEKRNNIPLVEINPAYLAGVADSDGSFCITSTHNSRKNPYYRATFQLTWLANEECVSFLESLTQKYGGSYHIYYYETSYTRNLQKNGTVKYSITGVSLSKLIEDVLPFLLLKKKQALNCLTLININKKNIGKKNRTPEINLELEFLKRNTQNLNGKNSLSNNITKDFKTMKERFGLV